MVLRKVVLGLIVIDVVVGGGEHSVYFAILPRNSNLCIIFITSKTEVFPQYPQGIGARIPCRHQNPQMLTSPVYCCIDEYIQSALHV